MNITKLAIISSGGDPSRYISRIDTWFAWRPVLTVTGEVVWLRMAKRIMYEFGSMTDTYTSWYEYEGIP